MTEPDEALLWAREQCATDCDERGFSHVAERYRRGAYDNLFEGDARAYRAGAAASAERIKELEGAVRSLIGIIDSNGLMHDPVYPPLGLPKRQDGQPVVDRVKQARRAVNEARAQLERPDQ